MASELTNAVSTFIGACPYVISLDDFLKHFQANGGTIQPSSSTGDPEADMVEIAKIINALVES